MSGKDAILKANAAFYSAFAEGNVEGMSRLWADDEDISCIHPGWPAIVGRAAVIGSWREILLSPARPPIACREPYAIVAGTTGHVICIELVGPTALAASNHFRQIDGAWRLIHHQSGPIAPIPHDDPPPSPPPGRQIH